MKQITAKEFLAMIENNPSVFENWNTPLEIAEYVSCKESYITHLSPHLHFTGKNQADTTAIFSNCENLKIATGNFQSSVAFINSGIEIIEDLNILDNNIEFWSASFSSCSNLKVATGTYPGFVSFHKTGIEKIKNLHVKKPNPKGFYADFTECSLLKTLKGWNLSKKIFIEPEKLSNEKERQALLKFHKKAQPKPLPFL
jgi:hypothetical protein